MTTRKFKFDTRKEAAAFAEGVEWVNDTAIALKSFKKVSGVWVLTYTDKDGRDE